VGRLLTPVLALFGLWLGALGWFWSTLPAVAPADAVRPVPTDGLVVLTGGEGRLARGLALLEQRAAKRLLVSGVHPSTRMQELVALSGAPEGLFRCCVDLGKQASNTIGNAREAAQWAEGQDFSSLRIVTSRTHLPRSLMEFRTAMTDLRIEGEAVADQPSVWGVIEEFNKYLVRLITVRGQAVLA
jgi:uncharacterized SAM-binding protein YcdF (DUF218 family)